MKAKEYFEKYKEAIILELAYGELNNTSKLFFELSEEVEHIFIARKMARSSDVSSILKELNQKWNAISSLFEKEYGFSPLKRNGFQIFWDDRLKRGT